MLLLLWSLSLFCSKKMLDSWNLVVQWLLKSSQNKLWENGGLVNASGVWTNTTGLTCMDLLMNWPPGIQLSVFKDGIFQEPDYKRLQFAAGCQMDLVMSAHQPCPINYTSTAVNFCILMSVLFFFFFKDSRECALSDRNNPVQPKRLTYSIYYLYSHCLDMDITAGNVWARSS